MLYFCNSYNYYTTTVTITATIFTTTTITATTFTTTTTMTTMITTPITTTITITIITTITTTTNYNYYEYNKIILHLNINSRDCIGRKYLPLNLGHISIQFTNTRRKDNRAISLSLRIKNNMKGKTFKEDENRPHINLEGSWEIDP
ncbi:hypothetical protein H8356DRAFT_1431885 [Neocallimastix lanati (nom. inval.)]|nr:hypothetical protein H8356DRAFT_1431885 [Neocallimastix sp. JGI-2020a]